MSSITKYRVLLETMQQGSLTKAAQKMGYTQSGVTHILNSLEKQWGLTLLNRNHNGAVITQQGQHLLPYLQDVVRAEEMLGEEVEHLKGREAGTIRVGSFSSVSMAFLPKLVKEFQELHPGVVFEVMHGDYTQIEGYLLNGLVDIGFLRAPIKQRFDAELFFKDRVMAVLPSGHPLAGEDSFPLGRFEEEPFIMLEADADNDYERYLKRNGINPRVVFRAPEDSVVMALIEQGLGIGLGYELSLSKIICDVVGVPLEVPFERRIHWAVRKGQVPTPLTQLFIEFLRRKSPLESDSFSNARA